MTVCKCVYCIITKLRYRSENSSSYIRNLILSGILFIL